MLGVFAEFERGIIRERVNAGLARARQNGTKLGRRKVKPSVEAQIRELRAKGDDLGRFEKLVDVTPLFSRQLQHGLVDMSRDRQCAARRFLSPFPPTIERVLRHHRSLRAKQLQ
jgi:DNA invertase Pin-like site-specific DNA recombinase